MNRVCVGYCVGWFAERDLRVAPPIWPPAWNQPPGLCRQFALKWALGVVAEIEEDSQIGTKVRM